MLQSFFFKDNKFVRLCGHRGNCLEAPENTLAAFRVAHAYGASSMEIDTVLSGDKRIVLLHDLLVDRTTDGSGPAKDLTEAELLALDAGSWFSPGFAGERLPTLRQTIDLAHELDLVLEVEIKEKLHLEDFTTALAADLADSRDLGRVMMISFDHAHLAEVKAAIPGIRTGGIVHERFGDPLAVAHSAGLDELCIDLSVFDPEQARALHDAGISIRCHAYSPAVMEKAERAGLGWSAALADYLQEGLIDTVSGDDVRWLRDFADRADVSTQRLSASPTIIVDE